MFIFLFGYLMYQLFQDEEAYVDFGKNTINVQLPDQLGKPELFEWRKNLFQKVKDYIDNNLNPEKLLDIDSTTDNFVQSFSIVDILNT